MLKHWFRSFYIMFCAMGVIIYITLFCFKPASVAVSFGLVCIILAPMMFFIGTIIYNVLKYFGQKYDKLASYFQLGMGVLTTALYCIGASALFQKGGISDVLSNNAIASQPLVDWYVKVFVTFAFFGQLVVFGLMPLLKGINKTFACTPEVVLTVTPEPEPEPAKKPRKPRTVKPKVEATVAAEVGATPAEAVKVVVEEDPLG